MASDGQENKRGERRKKREERREERGGTTYLILYLQNCWLMTCQTISSEAMASGARMYSRRFNLPVFGQFGMTLK